MSDRPSINDFKSSSCVRLLGGAVKVPPDREQLGPYNPLSGPLGRRNGLLDDQRVIVVAVVSQAQDGILDTFFELTAL